MSKKLSAPPSPCTKPEQSQSQLLNMMLDRFWSDTLRYLDMKPAAMKPAAQGAAASEKPKGETP